MESRETTPPQSTIHNAENESEDNKGQWVARRRNLMEI